MSKKVFPLTSNYSFFRTQEWRTIISEGDSGVEQRRQRWSRPRHRYAITLDPINREDVNKAFEFFKEMQGSYDSFYFEDFNDDAVTDSVGIGTGTTQRYLYTLSSPPVKSKTVNVYTPGKEVDLKDPQGDGILSGTGGTGSIIYDTGNLDITVNAPSGQTISCTYNFYRRVRFAADIMSAEMFAYHLYRGTLELVEVFDTEG